MATSVRQWGDQVTKGGTKKKGDIREGASPKQTRIEKKRELQKPSVGNLDHEEKDKDCPQMKPRTGTG